MAQLSFERLVEIGVVGRPHGLRGEANVRLHNDKSDILGRVSTVVLATAAGEEHLAVVGVKRKGEGVIVRFEGVDDRDDADVRKGARLLVPRAVLPAPEPGEFYVDDLIGLEASVGGVRMGCVTQTRDAGGVEIVTVDTGAETIEVPVAEDFVVAIDWDARRIELHDIDDLPRERSRKGRGADHA
ncbi:MAG: ribosome maturation factor RimM [Deltaproteobacteria bacterium]|nr:ribosome maturation factor RimM [Deltaproteobacteria bacterium]